MARLIKARAPDIIFTSSGAEANNLAIKGAALAHQKKGRHVIVSAIEHHSVLNSARYLEKFHDFEVTFLPVNRLGLARAMVLEPEVLFLDEPTASIDQANTEIIEEIIMKMKAEKKVTIIMVTHDPAQADRLGDRLLFMKEGRLLPG